MTLQEYINYISDYGTHVQFKYGDYIIQKMVHLTPYTIIKIMKKNETLKNL